MRSVFKRFSFYGLSIQHRILLLTCVVLSGFILTFGWVSYHSVKKITLEMGKKRLRSLTDQLGTMFSQSAKTLNTQTLAFAGKDTIKECIQSGGTKLRAEALEMLNKSRKDSTWQLVELLNSNKTAVLWSGNKGVEAKLSLDTIFSSVTMRPDSCMVGKIYAKDDSMYYPVIATVTDNKEVIGYLVIWRSLSSNSKGVEQLSQLIGTGATLYIGNTDGSYWTNLIKPVPAPPVDLKHSRDFFEYTDKDGNKVIAAVQPIANTKWSVLVEFSEETVIETATSFIDWTIIFGGILIAMGILVTWLMCRNIVNPLRQLTLAATAIAGGDYSSPVKVNRIDELGKLANAFNTMSEKIHSNQAELENKVAERTSQLEIANKELESFTYSVSHDLRSPLRIINGYAEIIKRDDNGTLPEDSKRMLENIIINAKRMGTLIDDLLNFSRLGKRELITHDTDMDAIVKPILDHQLNGNAGYNVKVNDLDKCDCDSNLIKHVWENLISNAVKYSSKNPAPVIEIGSFREDNKVVYYIKDNGAGFSMKYYDKLFGVFQRLHNASEYEGTGVGLALAQRIISKHGGRIWAQSVLGEGSTFYFTVS